MVSVECPEVLPESFGSPVQSALLSESSYSTDTGEFIRNVTECIASSFYSNSFVNLQDQVASEDEVIFPFGSDTSSHHSLSVGGSESPWPRLIESHAATGQKLECSPSPSHNSPNDQGRSSYSSSVVRVERVSPVRSEVEEEPPAFHHSLWGYDQPELHGADVHQSTRRDLESIMGSTHRESLDVCGTVRSEDDGVTPTPETHPFRPETTPTLQHHEGSGSSQESLEVQEKLTETPQVQCDQKELLDEPCTHQPEVLNTQPHRRASHSELRQDVPQHVLPASSRRTSLPLLHVVPPSLILTAEFYSNSRKHSDPAVNIRKEMVHNRTLSRQRCLSDSEAPRLSIEEDDTKSEEEGGSSVLGYDSGYHDEKSSRFQESWSYFSPRVSLQSSDLISLDEVPAVTSTSNRLRRPTPHPLHLRDDGSQSDDHSHSSATPLIVSGTLVHPRDRSRRSMLKNLSQSSLGGASSVGMSSESQSVSLSSILDCHSDPSSTTDLLSSLGFDDFNSPQLIPDRFIPRDVEHAKPSLMRSLTIDQYESFDYSEATTVRSNSVASGGGPSTSVHEEEQPSLLPLGATADNFVAAPPPPPPLPPAVPVDDPSLSSSSPADTEQPIYPNTANISYFNRMLETVPEETASDLSPSPRWLSPRVSIDHSVIDVADGKLGASLNVQKPRKRSLPQREGYKLSLGSLVDSDPGESIQFSVTSYDDELAIEREKEREEGSLPIPVDDHLPNRRRRRGVYTPPPSLLSWLSTQQPIHEEDPNDLPWPFSEQLKLRKSLTEIQQAQEAAALNEAESSNSENVSLVHTSNENDTLAPRDLLRRKSHDQCVSGRPHSPPLSPPLPRSPPDSRVDLPSNTTSNSSLSSRLSPPLIEGEDSNRHTAAQLSSDSDWNQSVKENSPEDTENTKLEEFTTELKCQRLEEELATAHAQSCHMEESLSAEIRGLEARLTVTKQQSTQEFLAMAETCQRLQEELELCRSELARERTATRGGSERGKKTQQSLARRKRELEEVKLKMRQERASEMKQAEQKHTQEVEDLKQALQLKGRELQQLACRLEERTEAASALSSQLKEHKRVSENVESKLRAALVDQKTRLEKQYHQEKVAALARFQEEAQEDKQRELYACKVKLQEEKKTALARLEGKMTEQVAKLQHQIQKVREQHIRDLTAARGEVEGQLADERERTSQLRESLSSCRKELEEAQRFIRDGGKRQLVRDREVLRENEKQQRNILSGLLEEWQKSAHLIGHKKPRPLSLGNLPVTQVLEVAMVNVKSVNDLVRQQVVEVRQLLDKEKQANTALHKHKTADLRRVRAQMELDKQRALKALKEKLLNEDYLLTDHQQPPVERGRAKEKESDSSHCEQDDHTPHPAANSECNKSPLDLQTISSHSPCRREKEALEKEVKVQQTGMQRARALYSEKVHEVTDLQAHIRQLAKERMQLEKTLQNALRNTLTL